MSIKREPLRPFAKTVKKTFGNIPIIGAEVGVGAGWNAVDMLNTIPNLKLLYLIDPHEKYEGYVDPELVFSPKISKNMIEVEWKEKATMRLNRFDKRKKWVRKRFEHCTRKDLPQKLDFIYIDGNHKYDYVKQDIIHSFNFIKEHAIIGGHDYTYKLFAADVSGAVKDYCKEYDVKHYHEENDWWFFI